MRGFLFGCLVVALVVAFSETSNAGNGKIAEVKVSGRNCFNGQCNSPVARSVVLAERSVVGVVATPVKRVAKFAKERPIRRFLDRITPRRTR